MQTREQLYKAALRRVQSRRQRVVTIADENFRAAVASVPQLAAAESRAARAAAAAARSVLAGLPEQTERLQAEVDRARQDYRALLARYGYTEEMFTPQYVCPLCSDSGEYRGRRCKCVQELARELRRQEIGAVSALELSHFETFRLDLYPDSPRPECDGTPRRHMAEIYEYCKKYAEHFSARNPSLLMTGTAGLGKTHLALAIANTALQRGADVIYITARSLFDQMEREKFAPGSDLSLAVQQAELLILDDLGTEYLTQYGISFLYDLVNGRMLRHLPTIYTTNITKEEMLRARYTEKTASRLLGSCELLNFYGDDIRLLEK